MSIPENEGSKEVKILFDKAAKSAGEITIKLHFQAGLHLQTAPEAIDNVITLNVQPGDQSAFFTFTPYDDEVITGMLKLSVNFLSMSQGFRKASSEGMTIIIVDDELVGKPKLYTSTGNGISQAITYFYRTDGKISKLKRVYGDFWPYEEELIYDYFESGAIKSITSFNHITYFHWSGDKIINSEEFEDDVKTAYTIYDYDSAGNIGGKTIYYRQPSGEYLQSFVFVYLYFDDGNLYKQLTYIPANRENDELELISTRTYDNYLEKINWFPVNEIVPGVMTQRNLPGSYRVQENGFDLLYNFTYEYNSEGKVSRRSGAGEVVTYEYF